MNDKTETGSVTVNFDKIGNADIRKTVSDDADSYAKNWTITATIPASATGSGTDYPAWKIGDTMTIKSKNKVSNLTGLDNAVVTVSYGGVTYTAQKYKASETPTEEFIYEDYRQTTIALMKKCTCKADALCRANGSCGRNFGTVVDGYCSCWNVSSDATVTISYVTSDEQIQDWMKTYPSSDLRNAVSLLRYTMNSTTGKYSSDDVASASAKSRVPGVFTKNYTDDGVPSAENGYKAEYCITLMKPKSNLLNPVMCLQSRIR